MQSMPAKLHEVASPMLMPFHRLESQCAAERRLKAERNRDVNSKAGFLGQLRHLNFVQQRLQSMWSTSAESALPEVGLDLAGERCCTCPGTAPPSVYGRPTLASRGFS